METEPKMNFHRAIFELAPTCEIGSEKDKMLQALHAAHFNIKFLLTSETITISGIAASVLSETIHGIETTVIDLATAKEPTT